MKSILGTETSHARPQDLIVNYLTVRSWGFVFIFTDARIVGWHGRVAYFMALLYEDLTKQIIGAIYKVYNSLGYGYKEKEYQKALASEFERIGLKYERELYSNITFNNKIISKFFVDFLVEK